MQSKWFPSILNAFGLKIPLKATDLSVHLSLHLHPEQRGLPARHSQDIYWSAVLPHTRGFPSPLCSHFSPFSSLNQGGGWAQPSRPLPWHQDLPCTEHIAENDIPIPLATLWLPLLLFEPTHTIPQCLQEEEFFPVSSGTQKPGYSVHTHTVREQQGCDGLWLPRAQL